jgi:hypothetical protein
VDGLEVHRLSKLIEIRKLAAVDLLWLGSRIVLLEYALGIASPLALGVLSVRVGLSHRPEVSVGQVVMGVWLMGIAAITSPCSSTVRRDRFACVPASM